MSTSRTQSPSVGADGSKKQGGFLQRFERALGLGDDHPQADYDSSSFHKAGVADSNHSSKAAEGAAVRSGAPAYASSGRSAVPGYATAGSRGSSRGASATRGVSATRGAVPTSASTTPTAAGTSPTKEVAAALGANDVRATRRGDVLQQKYEEDQAASKHHNAAGDVGAMAIANKLDGNDRQHTPAATTGALASPTARAPQVTSTQSPRNIESVDRSAVPASAASTPMSNPAVSTASNPTITSASHLGAGHAATGGSIAAAGLVADRENSRSPPTATLNTPTAPRSSNVSAGAPIVSKPETSTSGGLSDGYTSSRSVPVSDRAYGSNSVRPTTGGTQVLQVDNVQPRVIGTTGAAANKFEDYTHVGEAHVDCEHVHIKHGRFANWRHRDSPASTQNNTGSSY